MSFGDLSYLAESTPYLPCHFTRFRPARFVHRVKNHLPIEDNDLIFSCSFRFGSIYSVVHVSVHKYVRDQFLHTAGSMPGGVRVGQIAWLLGKISRALVLSK